MTRTALALVLVAVPLAAPLARAQTPPAFVLQWGSAGSDDGQFIYPLGLAVDGPGNVYVADQLGHRIQKFDNNGVFLTKWGTHGTGDGQLGNPADVAVGPNGHVYVTEIDNHRVSEFTDAGVFVRKWGSSGVGPGQFDFPYGIEVDHGGNVYVTDKFIPRVSKFSGDGTFLDSWSLQPGASPGGIACDAANNVYIADSYSENVLVFSSAGAPITSWPVSGDHPGWYTVPQFLTVTSSGVVCVSDGPWVGAYTLAGDFITEWGGPGAGPGQFQGSTLGIGLDGTGNLFVVDFGESSISKFGGGVVPVRGSSWGRLKSLYR